MPPKKGSKRPAAGASVAAPSANPKLSAETEEINAKLSAVDLLVAEMRSQLEGLMEPCMEEMRKEVAFFLMRLPSRVKGMKMSDFLRECGGDVQLLLEKERRAGKCVSWRVFFRKGVPWALLEEPRRRCWRGLNPHPHSINYTLPTPLPAPLPLLNRLARTAAKGLAGPTSSSSSSSSFLSGGGGGGGGGSSSSSSSSASLELGGAKSPHGGRGVGGEATTSSTTTLTTTTTLLPARTPSMAVMRSAVAAQGHGILPSRTPGMPQAISTFLPKTPAQGDSKKPRNARRNEMVYHMILSENGSPIQAPQQPLRTTARISLGPAPSKSLGSRASLLPTSAPIASTSLPPPAAAAAAPLREGGALEEEGGAPPSGASTAPSGSGSGSGAAAGAGALHPTISLANIELDLGDSTAISLGDSNAMDVAAADPELAASMEAALGALAAQVKEMQRRLAATKAAARMSVAVGEGGSSGSGSGSGSGSASSSIIVHPAQDTMVEDDPWGVSSGSGGSGSGSGSGEGGSTSVLQPLSQPVAAPVLPNSAVKRGVGPRVARTVARVPGPSKTAGLDK